MTAKKIIDILEKKYPKKNAEEWDNVGLLVGDYNKDIKKIQFSLDATSKAIDNAIKENVDMIITHHPLIFKGIKNILSHNFLGKRLTKLIKNDINLYSMHTNLDASRLGLNELILEKLGVTSFEVLEHGDESGIGIGRIFELESPISIDNYINLLKQKLRIDKVRVSSHNLNANIKKIALINGSAMDYWNLAKNRGVDLFITGDVTYHNALDALESGLNIIDFGHFESENFFYEILKKELNNLDLELSVFNDGPIFKII